MRHTSVSKLKASRSVCTCIVIGYGRSAACCDWLFAEKTFVLCFELPRAILFKPEPFKRGCNCNCQWGPCHVISGELMI